jgi:uncharacterized RDD family membrane protein YckC
MTEQGPTGEPPPEPPAPDPGAETTRLPWETTQPPPAAPPSPATASDPGAPAPRDPWAPTEPPPPPVAPPGEPLPWAPPPPSPPGAAGGSIMWADPTPAVAATVPGAPGLRYADTASRLVAYLIDGFLIGIVASIVGGLLGYGRTTVNTNGAITSVNTEVSGAALYVPFAIISLVYFVIFWTGGRRATIGQQIFKIQVGNATNGAGLTPVQAVTRWAALGFPLYLVSIVPAAGGLAGLALFIWWMTLLVTTIVSPTGQGLHDRIAGTALVRPLGDSNTAARACLVIVIVIVLLFLFSILALIFLGSQASDILRDIGNSV